jgi:hypothetical protein
MRRAMLAMVMGMGLVLGACAPGPSGGGRPSIEEEDDGGGGGGGGGSEATTTALTIRNSSSVTIWYAYISPSGNPSWGPDQLGSRVLSPGSSIRFTGIPCGRSYDLKVEGSGHATLATRYGQYLSCTSEFTWTLTN